MRGYLEILISCNSLLGTVPMKRSGDKKKILPTNQAKEGVYVVSVFGLLCWVFALAASLYVTERVWGWNVAQNGSFASANASEAFKSCYEKNFCTEVAEILLVRARVVFARAATILYRFRAKGRCWDEATELDSNGDGNDGVLLTFLSPKIFGLFLLSMCVLEHSLQIDRNTHVFSALRFYEDVGLLFFNNLILAMYYACEQTLADINERLLAIPTTTAKMTDHDYSLLLNAHLAATLRSQRHRHWRVGTLVLQCNDCFGPNFVLFWPHNVVRTILFFLNIKNYWRSQSLNAALCSAWHFVQILAFFVEMIYYARRGTRVTQQAERTKVCLQYLQLRYRDQFNEETLRAIAVFQTMIKAREIKVTAGGFFDINMRLIRSFASLILTYWVILAELKK